MIKLKIKIRRKINKELKCKTRKRKTKENWVTLGLSNWEKIKKS
jgi:hypothetical protein